MKIQLTKTLSFRGNNLNELELDLEGLTGNDLINAEKQTIADENLPMVTDFSRAYLAAVAAQALKMPVEVLRDLPVKEFTKIVNEVQRFLLASVSSATDGAEIQATAPEMFSEESA